MAGGEVHRKGSVSIGARSLKSAEVRSPPNTEPDVPSVEIQAPRRHPCSRCKDFAVTQALVKRVVYHKDKAV